MSQSSRALVGALVVSALACWSEESRADQVPQKLPSRSADVIATVEDDSTSVSVILDFAKVLTFDQPARTIIIGNPTIVDGTLNDERTIVLTGKSSGRTNLIVLGDGGREISSLVVNVAAGDRQMMTVYHGAVQQTFSCIGPCKLAAPASNDK